MADIINLDDFRKSNELEEEYLKFLTHTNKFVKVPTNIPELARCFYFTLRYLEGNINAFDILTILKPLPENEVAELKEMLVKYLTGLLEDLNKF